MSRMQVNWNLTLLHELAASIPRSLIVMTLVLYGPSPLRADDVRGVPVPGDEQLKAVDQLSQLIWSMGDVLQQHHFAAPPRDTVILLAGRVLTDPENTRDDREVVEGADVMSLRACQSSEEFVQAFRSAWNRSAWSQKISTVPFRDVLLARLSQQIGSEVHVLLAKDYAVEEQMQNNRYVGLGVTLMGSPSGKYASFPMILPGGAAERAGLQNGVTILAVDGHSTEGIDMPAILDWLRGPRGSQVTLRVGATQDQPERDVTLTRSVVRLDSVFGVDQTPLSRNQFRTNDSEITGYLHVVSIMGSTLHELREADARIRQLGIRALVLDFRMGRQAEDIHSARLVADALMDGGAIWIRQERGLDPVTETADRECLFRGLPIVIAVDNTSGSAHLALAAALQDAGRATIVGGSEVTKYQGHVPGVFPAGDGQYVLRFPCACLVRARADRGWPLKPDVVVESGLVPQDVKGRQIVASPSESLTLAPRALPARFSVLTRARQVAQELIKQ